MDSSIALSAATLDDSLDGETHGAVFDKAVSGQEVCGVEVSAHEEICQNLRTWRKKNVGETLDVGPRHVGAHLSNPHLEISIRK